jgi:hypothetical protein
MRTRHFLSVALLAIMACPTALWAQSLADVARAEEERRKAVKAPAKVYTNDNLTKGGEMPSAAPAPATPAQPSTSKPASATAKPDSTKPAADGRDEKYWKARIEGVQQSLARNKVLLDALQSRVNALNTDFVNMDDPAKRQVIQQNLSTALAEMERMKQDVEKLNKEIISIQDEARRAGVPPGWLR